MILKKIEPFDYCLHSHRSDLILKKTCNELIEIEKNPISQEEFEQDQKEKEALEKEENEGIGPESKITKKTKPCLSGNKNKNKNKPVQRKKINPRKVKKKPIKNTRTKIKKKGAVKKGSKTTKKKKVKKKSKKPKITEEEVLEEEKKEYQPYFYKHLSKKFQGCNIVEDFSSLQQRTAFYFGNGELFKIHPITFQRLILFKISPYSYNFVHDSFFYEYEKFNEREKYTILKFKIFHLRTKKLFLKLELKLREKHVTFFSSGIFLIRKYLLGYRYGMIKDERFRTKITKKFLFINLQTRQTSEIVSLFPSNHQGKC